MYDHVYEFALKCCGQPLSAAARHAVGEARRVKSDRVYLPYEALRAIHHLQNLPPNIDFWDRPEGVTIVNWSSNA